jgi:hypothetical protein
VESSRAGSWLGSSKLAKIEPSLGSAWCWKMLRRGLVARLTRLAARRATHLPPKISPTPSPRDLNLDFSPYPTPSVLPRPLPAPPATNAGYRHRRRLPPPPSLLPWRCCSQRDSPRTRPVRVRVSGDLAGPPASPPAATPAGGAGAQL